MTRWSVLPALLLSFSHAGAAAAPAADPCNQYTWNIRHERELFTATGEPMAIGAAATASEAPAMEPGRLYLVHVVPEDVVVFAAPRGRELLMENGNGGLVRFLVKKDALYRISLDANFWVDVVRNGERLRSRGAQVVEGCTAPQKVVEFDLPAGTELILQLSGAAETETKVAITVFAPQKYAQKQARKGKPRRAKQPKAPALP